MQKSKIDFLLPIKSQYGALHYFTEKIFEVFQRKGFECRLIDVKDHFKIPVHSAPDMTFGLNGVPFDEERHMLCDIIERPHFSYLIDPPYRFFEIFSSPYILTGCDDLYCCQFLQDLNYQNTFFLPHGVDKNLSPLPSKKKKYDAIMLASYINYSKLRLEWQSYLPKIVSQVMDDAIDLTFSDDHTSFIQAFSIAYQDRLGLSSEPERLSDDFILPLLLLERYIKGKERAELITSLPDVNILLFNGHPKDQPGWESFLNDQHPNIKLHPPVSYEEGLEFMKEAKIVLNAFSKNKEGTHDRVLNGLASGALVLTNENIFMKKFFKDEENILFFSPQAFDQLNDKVMKYIENDSLREQVVEKGRKEVMDNHTWDKRIESLLLSKTWPL